jgi:hypothetical protein
MSSRDADPWIRWYDAYRAQRSAWRRAQERQRAANLVAGLLLAYMLFGGVVASVAVGLVMSN